MNAATMLTIALALCLFGNAHAAPIHQPAPSAAPPTTMLSRFAADLDPDNPLPEHPRPLFRRDTWQSLNGRWDYAITDNPLDETPPSNWVEGGIVVPFPVESALSGVQQPLRPDQALWYRRTFSARDLLLTVPEAPPRLMLHFGAVDYHAVVFINGREVRRHAGGYEPFSVDITDALRPADPQEIIVRVTDPTDTSHQPRGKQTLDPHGIWYTAVSGIWQTVWLEPVSRASLISLSYTIDPGLSWVQFGFGRNRPLDGDEVRFTLRDADGQVVGSATEANQAWIPIAAPRPWSPASPHLYDVTVEIIRDGRAIDTVHSYVALRTVTLDTAPDGFPRVHLNGQPIFLLGPLDQGWWPDGLYTAPTDEAVRFDIEQTLAMGFNCTRKHVKIEPQRWYYWADRLGLLVIQDMPSGDAAIGPSDPDLERTLDSEQIFRQGLGDMIRELKSHPSIIAWVPFNEGWGQFKTNDILQMTMNLDPTRLVGGPSGWTDRGVGHFIDAHVYPGPGMLPPQMPDETTNTPARASLLGEFGGLGLTIPDHTWKLDGSWGYRSLPDAATLERDYASLIERLRPLQARGLAGAIYTQLTDVEIEVNGLLTYDRQIAKIPIERLAAINARAFLPPPRVIDIAPTSELVPTQWRYTTEHPGPGWEATGFDDSAWPTAPGGFGTPGTPGAVVRTEWTTGTIWLRRHVDFRNIIYQSHPPPPTTRWQHVLRIHHDEDVRVYLNGVLIHAATGYQTGYIDIPLGPEDLAAAGGPHGAVLAIECTQTTGGQYIDAGIILIIDDHPPP